MKVLLLLGRLFSPPSLPSGLSLLVQALSLKLTALEDEIPHDEIPVQLTKLCYRFESERVNNFLCFYTLKGHHKAWTENDHVAGGRTKNKPQEGEDLGLPRNCQPYGDPFSIRICTAKRQGTHATL